MLVYLCVYSHTNLITHMLIHPPTRSGTSSAQLLGLYHIALIPTVEDWGIILLSESMKILSLGLTGAFCISCQIWHQQPGNGKESLGSQQLGWSRFRSLHKTRTPAVDNGPAGSSLLQGNCCNCQWLEGNLPSSSFQGLTAYSFVSLDS